MTTNKIIEKSEVREYFNGSQNAGLLAIEMISLFDESIKKNLKEFRENLHTQVRNKNSKLSNIGPDNYLQNK